MRRRRVHLRVVTGAGRRLTVTIAGDLITLRETGRRIAYTLPLGTVLGRAYLDAASAEAYRLREERKRARRARRFAR